MQDVPIYSNIKQSMTLFLHLPLEQQLIDLLENHELACKVFKSKANNTDDLCDIYDGELYKIAM